MTWPSLRCAIYGFVPDQDGALWAGKYIKRRGAVNKSLAGTSQVYVSLQGSIRVGCLHIQGAGPEVNRPYGLAIDIPASVLPEGLWDWLRELNAPLNSLYSVSGVCYFPMQARPKGDNLHFQVLGAEFNRSYGATFDIPLWTRPALEQFYDKSNAVGDC